MVFIRSLRIQGFKSYKDQALVGPFSPGHNAVVGRNGAGKSNFFAAIRFVLSDAYSQLRPEERTALLHEGAGQHVMSAFVEIVFDNSDGRFCVPGEEVVVRRTIGLKKDEYYLDNRHVQKNEIVRLLESAGFSRSNPYYIVQQGKIKELTVMRDAQRLELLKEVAGTSVYDRERAQSLKLMEEADDKVGKVRELLRYIEARLNELQEEKDELREYQRLDRDRRAIEYAVYEQDHQEANAGLEAIESQRREQRESTATREQDLNERRGELQQLRKAKDLLEIELKSLKREIDNRNFEREQMLRSRAKLDLTLTDLKTGVKESKAKEQTLRAKAASLDADISEARARLAQLEPQLNELSKVMNAALSKHQTSKRRIEELYSKRGRTHQFGSVDERDAWIRTELSTLEGALHSEQEQLKVLKTEQRANDTALARLRTKVSEHEAQVQQRGTALETAMRERNDKLVERDSLQANRRDLWNKEREIDAQIQLAKAAVQKAERRMHAAVSQSVVSGVDAVRSLAAEHKIKGVYGPLIELFQCDDAFRTAIEVTAGNRLFNVVVDTHATAARLVTLLQQRKAGRVTFMPLSNLQSKDVQYPTSPDAMPLISRLRFSSNLKPAFMQLFGKTLLCRDMDVASNVSTAHGFDCVTMSGERVSRVGAMTGGFIDLRQSRIGLLGEVRQANAKLSELQEEASKVKTLTEEIDQQINSVDSLVKRLEAQTAQMRTGQQTATVESVRLSAELENLQQFQRAKEEAVNSLSANIERLQSSIASLRSELGTELHSSLPADEREELEELHVHERQLQEEAIASTLKHGELEAQVGSLRNELESFLLKSRSAVEAQLRELDASEMAEELERKQKEHTAEEKSLKRAEAHIAELAKQQETKTDELNQAKSKVEELETWLSDRARESRSETEGMEQLLARRAILINKKEESLRKIRELGSLPQDAFSTFSKMTRRDLEKRLDEIGKQLRKYEHVNKKAAEQYVTFVEERDRLNARLEEANTGAQAIRDLVDTLDQRKFEALERTFRQVTHNFENVFQELVPHGRGALVMQVDDAPTAAAASQDAADSRNYVGVGIKVSFNNAADTMAMHQLSGGQKSLVALALIFAIQRCDPAPFYLFDEIDSALDPVHRTAVANMILAHADQAQFITTTFKPELVQYAQRCFKVSYLNKVSSIAQVETAEALDAVADETTQ